MNITGLAEQVATAHELDKAQTRKVIEATLKAVVRAWPGADDGGAVGHRLDRASTGCVGMSDGARCLEVWDQSGMFGYT